MAFIWQHRQHMTRVPHALPTFLQSVNWQLLEQRQEAYRLLRRVDALLLPAVGPSSCWTASSPTRW